MSQNAANDFLMGSGAKSASWDRVSVGHTISGTIVSEPVLSQQTDMVSKLPQWWDEAKTQPKQQLIVTLLTDQREGPDDDGRRALYVKNQMRNAIADAVIKAGATGLAVGGTLTVRYIGEGQQTGPGLNPPKHFDAAYVPPANVVLMGDPAPAAANGLPPLQPQAAAPAPALPTAVQSLPPLSGSVPAASPAAAAFQAAQAAATVAPTGVDPTLAAALGALSPEVRQQLAAAGVIAGS